MAQALVGHGLVGTEQQAATGNVATVADVLQPPRQFVPEAHDTIARIAE